MQWPKNRNILVVVVIVILAIAIAVAGVTMRSARTISDEPLPGVEASGDVVSEADVALYLLITADSTTYAPIPLDDEHVLTLDQGDGIVNVIHANPDSVWMESATCENQDCVDQGVVTVENRKTRLLGNMIICLPHLVQVELYTADELLGMGIPTAEQN